MYNVGKYYFSTYPYKGRHYLALSKLFIELFQENIEEIIVV